MLLHVDIPHEPFNSLVRAGTGGDTLTKILDSLKPEAVYLTELDGRRGAACSSRSPTPPTFPGSPSRSS